MVTLRLPLSMPNAQADVVIDETYVVDPAPYDNAAARAEWGITEAEVAAVPALAANRVRHGQRHSSAAVGAAPAAAVVPTTAAAAAEPAAGGAPTAAADSRRSEPTPPSSAEAPARRPAPPLVLHAPDRLPSPAPFRPPPPPPPPATHTAQVFREDGIISATGGLDWFEGAIARPDKILKDLVRALSPEKTQASSRSSQLLLLVVCAVRCRSQCCCRRAAAGRCRAPGVQARQPGLLPACSCHPHTCRCAQGQGFACVCCLCQAPSVAL